MKIGLMYRPTDLFGAVRQACLSERHIHNAVVQSTINSQSSTSTIMFHDASQSRRIQKASSKLSNAVVSTLSTGTVRESDTILVKAIWDAIGSYTKEALIFMMGQIVMATNLGRNDERDDALATTEFMLSRAMVTPAILVQLFMALLREASTPTLKAMMALVEDDLEEYGSDDIPISFSPDGASSDKLDDAIDMASNTNSADMSCSDDSDSEEEPFFDALVE